MSVPIMEALTIRAADDRRVTFDMGLCDARATAARAEALARTLAELSDAFDAIPAPGAGLDEDEARAARERVLALVPLARRVLAELRDGPAADVLSLALTMRSCLDRIERERARWIEEGRALGMVG